MVVQSGQIHGDGEANGWFPPAGEGDGVWPRLGTGSALGRMEGSGNRQRWWLHHVGNVLSTPSLYILNR